jgi:hypothetical protein
MNAKFNFYSGNVQRTQRPVVSVQEARGLAKKTLRRLGSTSWAIVFVDGLRITISQRDGQWQVNEEVFAA